MSHDTAIPTSQSATAVLGKTDLAVMLGLAALLGLCYWKTVLFTANIVVNSDDMAHGLFAPLICGYILWQDRDVVFRLGGRGNVWAIPLLVFAGLLGVVTTLGGSTTLNRVSLILSFFGVILLVGGWQAAKKAAFPVGLLFFTFPIPAVLYGEITQPLQILASIFSERSLEALGYTVFREGNVIRLPGHTLSVAEACSGLRSLITLAFSTIVYAYFFETRLWKHIALALFTIPAAMLLNVARVTITGVLVQISPVYTHGTYHDVLGWTCFIVAFGLVLAFHRGLSFFKQPHATPSPA